MKGTGNTNVQASFRVSFRTLYENAEARSLQIGGATGQLRISVCYISICVTLMVSVEGEDRFNKATGENVRRAPRINGDFTRVI